VLDFGAWLLAGAVSVRLSVLIIPSVEAKERIPEAGGHELDEVERLRRANEELRRTNAKLARTQQSSGNTAAVPLLLRLRRAETKLAGIESSVSWRLTWPLRWLKDVALRVAWVMRPHRGDSE
jgi:hypothetical protein